jgi:uncharacterized protein (TIGR02246 family)
VPAWLCLVVLAGCSGRDARPVAAVPRRESPLPAATPAADLVAAAGQPTIGPVPEVVSRPRPFRLPVRPAVPAAGRSPIALAAATLPEPSAAEPQASEPIAADAIRGMLRGYLRSFNAHDAEAVAAHWTGSGESVDLASGEVTAGRDAVRSVFTALFAEDDAAKIDIDVAAIRQVRDDVAVVDGVTRLSFADGTASGSRFTAVVVNDGGRWMLESVREAPQAAAAGRPLDALAWLVGSWEDDGAGVTASTQSFWSAGRAFLVRTHSVAEAPATPPAEGDDAIPGLLPAGDAGPRELTEIIGWDPERRVVRSWLYSSTGRFGEATWSREGDAWRLHVAGRGADAGLECVCTIEPVGPDRVELRCAGDGLAGLLPPACAFERTARLGGPPAP